MSVFLPAPVPLDMPPGDADGVRELARAVTSAAFRLDLLDGQLTGPAAQAPGWLGDDAEAAVVQLHRLVQLVRDGASTLDTAAARLSAHSEVLDSARAFVAALQEHQEADFSVAEYRLARLVDPAAQMSSVVEDPAAVAVVEDLEAAETARRRQHGAVLDDVAGDAAVTAAVLAEASRAVGGLGATGDDGRVVAYLARVLPGWGDAELAARGRALAAALQDGNGAEDEARAAAVLAGSPAFAAALLAALGTDGLRGLFLLLGRREFDDDLAGRSSAVAGLLATALGAAAGAGDRRADQVLEATYVVADSGDPDDVDPDYVAIGLAMVLVAGGTGGGPASMTVASWTRQVLAREHAQRDNPAGTRAVHRVYPNAEHDPAATEFRAFDPVPVLVAWLADSGTPASAAATLGEESAWTVLLDRSWDDGGAALADVVSLAATHPGAAGARAAWSGLTAIGGGLVAGPPSGWTVDRQVVAAVTPALGQAVAAHVSVATAALTDLSDGAPADGALDVVRGLGYLTVDREVAGAVATSLRAWTLAQPHDLAGTSMGAPLPAIAVTSGFVAAQEYGQRLTHALHGFEAQADAELRERVWGALVEFPVSLVEGPWSVPLSLLEGYAAIFLDMDGTWENGVDSGPVLDGGDAVVATRAGLGPDEAATAAAVSAQARAAYDQAIAALGRPEPPTSEEHDYGEPLYDALSGLAADRLAGLARSSGAGGMARDPD